MTKIEFPSQLLKQIVNKEVNEREKANKNYDEDMKEAHSIICDLSKRISDIRKQAIEIQQWFPYIKRNQIEKLIEIIDGMNEHSIVSRSQVFKTKA